MSMQEMSSNVFNVYIVYTIQVHIFLNTSILTRELGTKLVESTRKHSKECHLNPCWKIVGTLEGGRYIVIEASGIFRIRAIISTLGRPQPVLASF